MTVTPDAYASAGEYRKRIRKVDAEDDDQLQRALRAISRVVDRKCHTFFWKDDTLQPRLYEPIIRPLNTNRMTSAGIGWAESENPWMHVRGDIDLIVDPIYDLTGLLVEIDDQRSGVFSTTMTIDTDFVVYPRNALTGPAGQQRPYQYFKRAGGVPWVPGATVRVTAYWGWPSVPDAIVEATIEMAAILRIESIRATAQVQQMDTTVEASKECQDILHTLIRAYTQRPRI